MKMKMKFKEVKWDGIPQNVGMGMVYGNDFQS